MTSVLKSRRRTDHHRDFLIPAQGKAVPYGVYDLTRNAGWVSIGIDHDTASFAVRTIGRWWQTLGRPRHRRARSLLITADAGGSNGARLRLWKWELQQLANRTGLTITTCHFPPGTSKWNTIEHRLFSYISRNWRGQPLVSLAVIVNLIGCFLPSLGDGLMTLVISWGGWIVFRNAGWILGPGLKGYMLMALLGLVLAVGVEWNALYRTGAWDYTPAMPTVPILAVGLFPVLQMLVLPPATALVIQHWWRWRDEPR